MSSHLMSARWFLLEIPIDIVWKILSALYASARQCGCGRRCCFGPPVSDVASNASADQDSA